MILSKAWSLNNGQQILTDMLVVESNNRDKDFIYTSGIKPLSVMQSDPDSNKSLEVDVTEFFPQAWRTYYPRLKLFKTDEQHKQEVVLYEEATNEFFKIDFKEKHVFKLTKSIKYDNANLTEFLMKKAKKTLNKFYSDSNYVFKTVNLKSSKSDYLLSFQTNKSFISFMNLNCGLEVNLNLNGIKNSDSKIGINQVTQLSHNSVLISAFNISRTTIVEDLSAKDLEYFIIEYPTDIEQLTDKNVILHENFKVLSVEGNLLSSKNDLLLAKIELNNFQKENTKKEEVRNLF